MGRPKVSIEIIFVFVLLAAVSFSILLDSLYHFGYFDRPVSIRNRLPPYHWIINYPPELNYRRSSLPYLNDIKEINALTETGAVFYSDVATSYYIAVSSTLYAANPKSNHRMRIKNATATAPDSLLHNLCHGGKYANRYKSLKDYFNAKNFENIKNGWGPIKYFIYNKDQINRNVINCSKDEYIDLSEILSQQFKTLFIGEYLDVYQIVE